MRCLKKIPQLNALSNLINLRLLLVVQRLYAYVGFIVQNRTAGYFLSLFGKQTKLIAD